MSNEPSQKLSPLAAAAERIWRAGVAAVDSERLVGNAIHLDGSHWDVCGHAIELSTLNRLAVVGAGKAGAGMAAAVEAAARDAGIPDKLEGWVNVPADCVRPLQRIHLHAARPAGVNEPTAEGVRGSRKILELVESLEERDVCLVLLSGGGSALLPAPVDAISLADKQAVTRHLMHSGATIHELNTVRKQLSQLKGGGLARACTAGTLIALVVSDVIGDPLDVIASGPTVADSRTPADALAILEKFDPDGSVPASVRQYLEERSQRSSNAAPVRSVVHNHVIGNNATALAAAAEEAARLGYVTRSLGSNNAGVARDVGRELAEQALQLRNDPAPTCLLSGGEPVVHLTSTDRPRKGGRNQEVVLAAMQRLWDDGMAGIAMLSGGTDGEDGPTDAAGAFADESILATAKAANLDPAEYLAINNSYPFFERIGGLLKTGPTHTNVMDLRVVLIDGRKNTRESR